MPQKVEIKCENIFKNKNEKSLKEEFNKKLVEIVNLLQKK